MRSNNSRGFTLIEVMAAAIMLLLVVAALSELLASQARREGDARGEALAALFADRAIAEVEESIARGTAPQIGRTERSEDGLRAEIEVRAFDPAAAAGAILGSAENASAAAVQPADGPQPSGGWLASPAAPTTPPVLEISVRVSHSDAPADAEAPPLAERTTFALNPAALTSLEGSEESEGENDGEGDE